MSETDLEVMAVRGNEAEVRVGERTFFVPYVVDGTRVMFAFDGNIYQVEMGEKDGPRRRRQRDHSMEAPMPGLVLKILVKPGDVVMKGTPLVVLEAMKMEHQVLATHDGTIDAINCSEGELVQPGVDLVTMS